MPLLRKTDLDNQTTSASVGKISEFQAGYRDLFSLFYAGSSWEAIPSYMPLFSTSGSRLERTVPRFFLVQDTVPLSLHLSYLLVPRGLKGTVLGISPSSHSNIYCGIYSYYTHFRLTGQMRRCRFIAKTVIVNWYYRVGGVVQYSHMHCILSTLESF